MTMQTDWTYHGGRIETAKQRYPDAPLPWIDLSTGINPHSWPGVEEIEIDWRALPDPEALAALEAMAARHFGVDPDHVCALPGTEIGLRLLGAMLAGPVQHIAPGYRTHAEMVGGSRAITIESLGNADPATLILANPSNPEGHVLPRNSLLHLSARCGAAHSWLVVDEAYADALPGVSITDQISDARALIVLRSFGKFFGLAGVRLGFLLGPRAMIAQMRAMIGSWPLSTAAVAIGTAAYRDTRWIAAMRDRLPIEVAAVDAMLARHGLRAHGACPLFCLIESEDAPALFERLARAGILTRPFEHDARWLRLGLPRDAAALDRLDRALADG